MRCNCQDSILWVEFYIRDSFLSILNVSFKGELIIRLYNMKSTISVTDCKHDPVIRESSYIGSLLKFTETFLFSGLYVPYG